MQYNSLHSDIRLSKTSKNDALKLLGEFEGNWVYIKSRIDVFPQSSAMENLLANYNKFKVKNTMIDTYSQVAILFGYEDEDRFIMSLSDIIQTEKSENNDEILFVLKYKDIFVYNYIKICMPNLERRTHDIISTDKHLIITEGKTDWKHLKNAFNKLRINNKYTHLKIDFFEYENSLSDNREGFYLELNKDFTGANTLDIACKYNAFFYNANLRIFVFDSDIKEINNLYKKDDKHFTYLGNNVYAVVLPIPESRKNTPNISIENYYSDEEIMTCDENNRRLYIAGEFENSTGFHKNENLVCLKSIAKPANYIIDDEIYCYDKIKNSTNKDDIRKLIKEKKLAKVHTLSKNQFAENVFKGVQPFGSFSIDNYMSFFEIVSDIYKDYHSREFGVHTNIVELQKGIQLKIYENHQELHLNILFSEKIIQEFRSKTTKMMSTYMSENKMIITLGTSLENEVRLCSIDITNDLFGFIQEKMDNSLNNRVYLNLYNKNNEYIASYELFSGDNGTFAFNRLYSSIIN